MTYDSTALETETNWIRLRVGDTDSADEQLADAEIQSLLSLHGNRVLAAAAAARAICAKYTRFGGMKEAEAFRLLAEEIQTEATPGYL